MSRKVLVFIFLSLLTGLSLTVGCSTSQLKQAQQLEKQGNPTAALSIYQQQYGKTPEYQRGRRAEIQYRMGECLLAMNRTQEAFSAFNKAVEIDDSHRMAHLRLGELYLLSGSVDRANDEARFALKHGSVDLESLSLMAAAAAASGHTEIAKQTFQTILERDPTRVKAALSLAELLHAEGNSEGARKVLLEAAKAQPRSSAPWVSLGRLDETLGEVKAAEEDYRKAVQIEDTPETNLRLAQYLERTAQVEEAQKILAHVDQLRPSFATASADFAMVARRSEDARTEYLKALSEGSQSQQTEDRARMVARLVESDLARNTRPQKGEAVVAPAELARQHLAYFRKDIDTATAHLLEAEIAIADSDLATASVQADAALQSAPDSAAAHYVAGLVKSRAGKQEDAESLWTSGLDLDENNIPIRLALAELSLQQNDPTDAQRYVVPVVRLEPANFDALMLFGRVLLAQREYPSVGLIAIRAEAVNPKSAGPDILRGDVAMAQNDPGNALIEYEKAVLRDPSSDEAIAGLIRAYRTGTVSREMLLRMERMGRQQPPSVPLLEIAGKLFAEKGWNDDAIRCLETVMKLDPTRSSAALQLARSLAASGKDLKATQYAEFVPGIRQVLQGVMAEERDDANSAMNHYEAAVRAGDRTGVAANNLAWLYAGRGIKLDQALSNAMHAAELIPNDPGVLDTLGYVHMKRREYTSAAKVLERAVSLARLQRSPALAEIEAHLKQAYLDSGQSQLAQELAQDSGSQR